MSQDRGRTVPLPYPVFATIFRISRQVFAHSRYVLAHSAMCLSSGKLQPHSLTEGATVNDGELTYPLHDVNQTQRLFD
jgi:hypothetical protein